ncbi:hypothetical protein PRIPAC_84386, partial [Pristionchus pacificus]
TRRTWHVSPSTTSSTPPTPSPGAFSYSHDTRTCVFVPFDISTASFTAVSIPIKPIGRPFPMSIDRYRRSEQSPTSGNWTKCGRRRANIATPNSSISSHWHPQHPLLNIGFFNKAYPSPSSTEYYFCCP